ncbi:hypothetical protein SAMN05660653_02528 [Desulfonatronum thiosulfatophilum]|uniref:PH domain-containing protein n=1 Tax=Desulfonatronum thiosulfatophilum TaxID=617002 RepID=A0A1G6E1M1_9BACT|nr:hypothetical protein [Desulfonatronum thiosulfatophilum]SDB51303.1 hypothetical protein SAMN05660653_02528 [Desulfonatronum thiosulfatophilum]
MSNPTHPPVYSHTQRGTLMILAFVPAGGFVLHQLVQGGPSWLWLLLAVAVVIGFTFSSLTVIVTASTFQAHFTPGWPRKSEHLSNIAAVRAVRNPWYYGWGIRLTPHGTLYNVSGLDAVEIRTKQGKTFRIGTDEPEKLQRVLENALLQAQR